ncbi:MAG: polysaccharide biosynthesis C-terminal domain-containing protein [Acutalibacteraceae bacterium]
MATQKKQGQSLVSGAMFLMVTTVIVHIIGVIYKIPLTATIGTVGRGYFTSAYEIYTPIYAISMAGLPVAVSKMVSERMATGKYREVREVRAVARKIYLATGLIGTAILLGLAYPYTHLAFFIHTPNAFWSVICIAPSILFCCMMSSYRGYYEGLRNMNPTGYSQVLETVGKLVFGLVLAKMVQNHGLAQFHEGEKVYGVMCHNLTEASSAIAPFSAAAAISGVTIGTILGLIYLQIRHRVVGDGITQEMLKGSPEPTDRKTIRKSLINLAIPVVLSSLVLNITNLIDTWSIQNRLYSAINKNVGVIKHMYAAQLTASHIMDKDIKDFLYGCYGTALDFRNIIPTVIMTLGVSAIPVLSGAYATKDKKGMTEAISSVLKTANCIAIPCGLVMAILAEPILRVLYTGTNAEASISISAPFVAVYGVFALLLSISTPVTNMLQSIGRADVPVKSLAVGAVLKIVCNYILVGIPSINIMGAPIGTLVCYAYIVCRNLYTLLRETEVKISWRNVLWKPMASALATALVTWGSYELFFYLLPAGQAGSRNANFTWATLIAIAFFLLAWIGTLIGFHVLSKSDVLGLPKGEKIAKKLEKRGLIH